MSTPNPSPEDDDIRIVAAAIGDDIGAFEALVRIHQGAIRSYLAARLAVSDDAEDLAQEVFIVAYRRRATFSGDRPISAWFRGIARNLLKNHVRKFRAKPIGGSDELQALLDRSLAQDGDAELLASLRECLGELEGPARDLIVARYLDGESVRQIETRTGRGYSALTMQLHRIRCLLAACVEAKLGFAP